MKVITQKEFDNFPIINSCKQCPSGDYTKIKQFENDCSFGENCKFGNCEFGRRCHFGDHCEFGSGCKFGEYCDFGRKCSFGEFCVFEGKCVFENGHVAKKGYPLLGFMGFGSIKPTTYFFNCEDGIWVRCGCFFGDIEQFRERVKQTRKGRLGKEYLMIADLVEMKWKNKNNIK